MIWLNQLRLSTIFWEPTPKIGDFTYEVPTNFTILQVNKLGHTHVNNSVYCHSTNYWQRED